MNILELWSNITDLPTGQYPELKFRAWEFHCFIAGKFDIATPLHSTYVLHPRCENLLWQVLCRNTQTLQSIEYYSLIFMTSLMAENYTDYTKLAERGIPTMSGHLLNVGPRIENTTDLNLPM